MNTEEIKTIEEAANKLVRPKVGEIVEKQKVGLDDVFQAKSICRRILDENIDVAYVESAIVNSHPLLKRALGKKIQALVAESQKGQNTADYKKIKRDLFENAKNSRFVCEAFYLSDINEEEKKQHVEMLPQEDKDLLMRAFVKLYQNNYFSFRALNKDCLTLFGKKLERKFVAQAKKDNSIIIAEDLNPILRAVGSAKFYCAKGTSDYYRNLKKVNSASIDCKEYNLLQNSAVFKLVKDSKNIQKLVPNIEKMLQKAGIAPNDVAGLNYADFSDIIFKNTGNEKTKFSDIAQIEELSPYQQFCKKIVEDKGAFETIIQDFRDNNISEEYIDLWQKSMQEDFSCNLDMSKLQDKTHIPLEVSVHHKSKVRNAGKYFNPLMVNDISNFALSVNFKQDKHAEEHLGDNTNFLCFREGKVVDVRSISNIKEGDVVMEEKMVDIDSSKNLPENAIYFSDTLTISKDGYKGLDDYTLKPSVKSNQNHK